MPQNQGQRNLIAKMKLIPVDPNNPEGHRTTCIRHAELSLRGV